MNHRQRAQIIADVQEATGRSLKWESVQRVLKGDYALSHPVDAAILASLKHRTKKTPRHRPE